MRGRGGGDHSPDRGQPRVRRVESVVDTGHAVVEPDMARPSAATLWVDGTPQSYVDLADPTNLVFEYVQHIAAVLEATLPAGAVVALHLGGGGCTLPRYLAASRPDSRQRVVEVDHALVELVRAELPLPASFRIRIATGDARKAIDRQRRAAYDAIVVDVFAAARIPRSLTTTEFFAACAAALRPTGVVIYNLVDGQRLRFARRLIATAMTSFPELVAAAEPGVWRGRRFSNLLLIGSRAPLPVATLTRSLAGGPFPARVVHGASLADLAKDAAVLTDASAEDSPAPPPRAFDLRK